MGVPVPPPWVLLSLAVAFAKNLDDARTVASLGWTILRGRGGGDAGCRLCDTIVNAVLRQVELDDLSEDESLVNCDNMCFRSQTCVKMCEKITGAMTSSVDLPCATAGFCPALDEFGEATCQWSHKERGCTPAALCQYRFPRCELRPGVRRWKRAATLVDLRELGSAIQNRKRCGEPGANSQYCIRDSEGLGRVAEWAGQILAFVVGSIMSVRAIETPGGDDDRQWLTFWIIIMLFTLAERFTDVLLSRIPRYYEIKLLFVAWLMGCDGADKIYRMVRRTIRRTTLSLGGRQTWLFPPRRDRTEDECILSLPEEMRADARRLGLREFMSGFRCDRDIAERYGMEMVCRMWRRWNDVDPRYLVVHLESGRGLPAMDDDGLTDAYVVCYLVPPAPEEELYPDEVPLPKDNDDLGLLITEKKMSCVPSAVGSPRGNGTGPKPEPRSPVLSIASEARTRLRRLRRLSAGPIWECADSLATSAATAISSLSGGLVLHHIVGGPKGRPGQYGAACSRVSPGLAPVWDDRLELRLGGGFVGEDGEYDNHHAPYASLRIEVWDRDLLTKDEFVGECVVPLCPLMDGRTHRYEGVELTDPEGVSEADGGAAGSITFSLQYES